MTTVQQPSQWHLWEHYEPSAARYLLGVYLADRRTKPSSTDGQLAKRYMLMVNEASGMIDIDVTREVCRKFELAVDPGWLQAKDDAQQKEFLTMAKSIERAMRTLKPSNHLKFQLARMYSDAGHTKDATQRISQAIASVHSSCGDRPVQDIAEIIAVTQACCRDGKFNQSHSFVLDSALTTHGHGKSRKSQATAVVVCANALCKFYGGYYEKAANAFAKVSFPALGEGSVDSVITREEIAVLGALSALAQLPRAQLQSGFVVEFSPFLDLVPCLRDALESFCRADYCGMFTAIAKLGALPQESYHLRSRIVGLMRVIRERAFVDCFESYTAISLDDIAKLMGSTPEDVLVTACALIKENKLPARVDAVNMVLERHTQDVQEELLRKTLADGLRYHETLRHLLLQTSMLSHQQQVTGKTASTGSSGTGGVAGV